MELNKKPKLLLVLEGNYDIRILKGLLPFFEITIIAPAQNVRIPGGIKERMEEFELPIPLVEIFGGRFSYQFKSIITIFKYASHADIILSQENLRGSLSAGLVGRLKGVPVVTYSGIPPREYFRCRYRTGQISWAKWFIGDLVIRFLLHANALLATRWLAMGNYLVELFKKYKKSVSLIYHYGVDINFYSPVSDEKKMELRNKHGFECEKYLVFFSSRISHEKDPRTVLIATEKIYKENPQIFLINLSGGHQKMRDLAIELNLKDHEKWLYTGPPAHPMKNLNEMYQLCDLVVQASLEEGLGLSPLEAMACGKPVICSNVGGMKDHLGPYCSMVEPQNVEQMKEAILDLMNNPLKSKEMGEKGRAYIKESWNSELAFDTLQREIKRGLN